MLVSRKELSRLSENQASLHRNKFNLQLKVERSSQCRPKPSNSSPENQRITHIDFPVQRGWGTDSKTKAWTCGKPFIWKLKALFCNVDGARVPKRRPEHVENPSYESYRLVRVFKFRTPESWRVQSVSAETFALSFSESLCVSLSFLNPSLHLWESGRVNPWFNLSIHFPYHEFSYSCWPYSRRKLHWRRYSNVLCID